MPGPNARPPISHRNLLTSGRAVRRNGDTVEVRYCGARTGAGVWIQCSDEHSAAITARRIFAFLNTARGDDDYNNRITMIGHSTEQEAAETQLQAPDATVAVAETREEQKAKNADAAKIVEEVTEYKQERGLLFGADGNPSRSGGQGQWQISRHWCRSATSQSSIARATTQNTNSYLP